MKTILCLSETKEFMREHVISKLLVLRAKLKSMAGCTSVEDIISQANMLMLAILKQEIHVDLMVTTASSNQLILSIIDMMKTTSTINNAAARLEISTAVQEILSCCMNCSLTRACEGAMPSSAMQMHEKHENIRTSLLAVL